MKDGTLEIRHFCSDSEGCNGEYIGVQEYCCAGVGIKRKCYVELLSNIYVNTIANIIPHDC